MMYTHTQTHVNLTRFCVCVHVYGCFDACGYAYIICRSAVLSSWVRGCVGGRAGGRSEAAMREGGGREMC